MLETIIAAGVASVVGSALGWIRGRRYGYRQGKREAQLAGAAKLAQYQRDAAACLEASIAVVNRQLEASGYRIVRDVMQWPPR